MTLTITGTNHNGNGPLGSDPNSASPKPDVQTTFYVGTKREISANTTVTNTITGGGTLALVNRNNELNIREVFGGGGGHYRNCGRHECK